MFGLRVTIREITPGGVGRSGSWTEIKTQPWWRIFPSQDYGGSRPVTQLLKSFLRDQGRLLCWKKFQKTSAQMTHQAPQDFMSQEGGAQ